MDIGLRKVVDLRVFDLPQSETNMNKEKSEEISFGYSFRNLYYLGSILIHKSKKINSRTNRKYNNEYLRKIAQKIASKGDLNEGEDFCYFTKDNSSLMYFGDHKTELINKVLTKK